MYFRPFSNENWGSNIHEARGLAVSGEEYRLQNEMKHSKEGKSVYENDSYCMPN